MTIQKKKYKGKVYPLSNISEEGVNEILYACKDLLETTPKFPLFDEEEQEIDYKKYSLEEVEKEFEIIKLKPHLYQIVGDKIIKFYKMTNISTDEGMMKLMSRLRALRVEDELEKMGAVDGDIVLLEDFEFEYLR